MDRYLVHRETLNRVMVGRGLATSDVARAIGVTPATLRHLRNGTRATVGEATLAELARVLDVAPNFLAVRIDDVMRAAMRRTRADSRDIERIEVIIHHRKSAS